MLAPELMSGRLDVALFADPVARSAFDALTQWPWHECLEQAPPEAAALLQRLAVEDPGRIAATRGGRDARRREPRRSRQVSGCSRRCCDSGDERSAEVKTLLDALVRERCRRAMAIGRDRSPSSW